MYGRKGAAGGRKEKWSASRAVKVVSLANETNIRADRVDKRARREEVSGRGEGAEEERARERRFFGGPALKLTRWSLGFYTIDLT